MNSPASSEASNSNSPTLSIDFRSGSVVMQLGAEQWAGELPISAADRSQINTPSGLVTLAPVRIAFESLPGSAG